MHFSPPLEPLLLLADSQMLFWKEHDERFLARMVRSASVFPHHAKAAYLGASNGDAPEFFELFQAAFADLGFARCMHGHAEPSAAERAFLAEADVISLAGGDAVVGSRVLEAAQLTGMLRARWSSGALLVGVSAGAMQLDVEPVRKPVTEVTLQDGIVGRRELLSMERASGPTRSQRDWSLN
jgi:peptidase E